MVTVSGSLLSFSVLSERVRGGNMLREGSIVDAIRLFKARVGGLKAVNLN